MDRLLTISKTIARLVILSVTTNLIIIVTQIVVQKANQEFYISIGFPFHFFYFNEPHGLHGSNLLHLIYDGLITIVLVSTGYLIYKRTKGKNLNKNGSSNLLDTEK